MRVGLKSSNGKRPVASDVCSARPHRSLQSAFSPVLSPNAQPKCVNTVKTAVRNRSLAWKLHSVPVTSEFSPERLTPTPQDASFPPPLPLLDESYQGSCAFAPYANWLLPGHVMLGRYPYVEPSRCLNRDEGDAQLEAIISAGITTFVCLQQELPPQHEMRLAGVDGFLPYRAPAQIIAAGRSEPPSLEEISSLRTPELDRYLPPRRSPPSYLSRRRIELDFLHSPIVDLGLPGQKQLMHLIDELSSRLSRGERLYVHCWGGRGRAGTVGAALLAHLYHLDAEEALHRVQLAFDTRKDEQRKSPETDEQRAFIINFVNAIAASR